ncbi:hypothetical protein IJD44_08725 [bacterium]|nr:hypothetical protein [bacterium]
MKKNWAQLLLLSTIVSMPVSAEIVRDIPGDGSQPIFEYTIFEQGETTLHGYDVQDDFSRDELLSVGCAGVIINDLINNSNQKQGAKIMVFHLQTGDEYAYNAYASSPIVEYYESNGQLSEYRTSAVNAAINGKKYIKDAEMQELFNSTGRYYDGLIGVGIGLSPEASGWDKSTTISALYQGTLPNLMIVIEHEIAHALGIASGSVPLYTPSGYQFYFSEFDEDNNPAKLTVYDKYLRVYDKSIGKTITPERGMPIVVDSSMTAEDYGVSQSEVFDISQNAPYFAGPQTMKVLSGVTDSEVAGLAEKEIIAYCENKIKSAGGLADFSGTYKDALGNNARVNGLPINGREPYALTPTGYLYQADLSHTELRNTYMSHQNYRNWTTFMEAELALLKDIGYDIDLKEYYGKSFYLDNTIANVVDDYFLRKNQAIGVHLYGENGNITQTSNVTTGGQGSFGVRIDGVGNTYTIDGGTIESKGANSIGLGVAYGSGHNINIKEGSKIKAVGANSSAVSFDFGKNLLGEYIEERGSYIRSMYGEDEDLNELAGPLVENFNVNGTIEAVDDAENAVYISPNAYVKNINIQENAKIDGAIVSRWNSERSGQYGRVQNPTTLFTNINFGADNSGNLDSSYVGSYSGKIDGNSKIGNVTKNTLKMNLAGTLNLGNADINVYNINNAGTINVVNSANLSVLDKNQSIVGDGNINVNSNAKLTLGTNTQNVANNINLASNAELSTINQSQNLTTIKNLKSESDSKLSLDLGDTFNLQNIDGFDIKLSQIKIGEEAVKTLEDGKTYQVFDDSSNVIDLNGSASIYYSGNKYSVTQDTADNKYLKVNWIGNSSGLREAAEDETAANYINTENPQPFDAGTVVGNHFEVSGIDVNFAKKYEGLTIDGASNAGGTVIKTSFYGGTPYNLKVQNGGILAVDSSDKDIRLGSKGEKAIIMNNGVVDLNAVNNKISVNGDIVGSNKATDLIKIKGNNQVDIYNISDVTAMTTANYATLNNVSKNVDWRLNSGVLSVADDSFLSSDKTNSLFFNGGTLNLVNNSANKIDLKRMELTTDANVVVDIDFAERKADTFAFENNSDVVLNGNKMIVSSANFSNAKTVLTEDNYKIPFVRPEYNNEALIGNVSTSGGKQVMTPIYKYGLGYSETGNSGDILLSRMNTGSYRDYNPSIFASTVGAQVGAYLTQINSYDMAFGTMDMLMSMPLKELNSLKYKNRYAIADVSKQMAYNPNQLPEEYKGIWFKPYATFEKVGLKDGPKVGNSLYSTYVGADSELVKLRKGWYSMYSGYMGYTGSHQHFDGVSIYQNGGQIGATGMLFKDRFFAGVTASAGLGIGDASTMYGSEDFSVLNAGAALKTGYNFGYNDDKLILQPSLLAGYSFINAYDYTNAAGVRIRPEDMHGLTIVPGVKLIGNLPDNWQPYLSMQLVWNMLTDTQTIADSVSINQFKIKPYIQYGIGVQKRVGDNFTGYFQSMGRSFGRNGVSLSAGMRWAVGRNKKETI